MFVGLSGGSSPSTTRKLLTRTAAATAAAPSVATTKCLKPRKYIFLFDGAKSVQS